MPLPSGEGIIMAASMRLTPVVIVTGYGPLIFATLTAAPTSLMRLWYVTLNTKSLCIESSNLKKNVSHG